MSDSYGTDGSSSTGIASTNVSGTLDAAKQEAGDLKVTATEQAKDVVGTAKDEAKSVATEAKVQAKDLFAQTQRELKDQANTQQQRAALGLRSVSDELSSMAANSQTGGVAADLVSQVSDRLSSASTWLGDRDPNSVLAEVKSFARRRPAAFILAAVVAGVVAGRLTRALAANASDEKANAADEKAALTSPDPWAPGAVGGAAYGESVEATPIYEHSAPAPAWTESKSVGDRDDRSDTF